MSDWYYQVMWLFSGTPDYPDNNTALEMHCTKILYSVVKCLMHTIWTEDNKAQYDAAYCMIQTANLMPSGDDLNRNS